MSKIYYEKHGTSYDCTNIENDECPDLQIIFSSGECGAILINGKIKTALTGGLATVAASLLSDGVYRPKLIQKNELFDLESFHIGTGVSRRLRSEEYIHSLYEELLCEKGRSDKLEERILALEKKINGQPII